MFSVFAFAILFISGINANDFEIRHLIELGSDDWDDSITDQKLQEDVKAELEDLICTSYTVDDTTCSIEGT